MAVPQRRISKTRKRLRRTHFKLSATGLVKCSHCGEMILPHRICPKCGYYDGKPATGKAIKAAEAEKAAAAAKAPKAKKATKAKKVEEKPVEAEVVEEKPVEAEVVEETK